VLTCSYVVLQMFSLLQQQKTESLDFVSFPSFASPWRLCFHVVTLPYSRIPGMRWDGTKP
jgi:hypothetical protein